MTTRSRPATRWAPLLLALAALSRPATLPADVPELRDKTLVVWAAPADVSQQGGAPISIQQPGVAFDAIVLGELAPARWMAGSEGFRRTNRDQGAWPAESAGPGTLVQVAVAYKGKHVSIYRDGRPYAEY